jgi:putative sterol carrier protein
MNYYLVNYMSTKKFNTLQECIKDIENRYKTDEKVRKKVKSFNDTLVITFLDTKRPLTITIKGDQGIELKDKVDTPDAKIKIEFAEEATLMKMFNKEIGAVNAYSSGQIKVVEGKIADLLKIRVLLF